jgi:hypothetical protein
VLPAVEFANGRKEYWVNGRLHRDGGLPAIECDESKEYWVNGRLHRDGGLPAIERSDGTKEYWVEGECIRIEKGGKDMSVL